MPTLIRLDWVSAGNSILTGGIEEAASELELATVPVVEKKEVICRWAGSLAAPANWRLVRGAVMIAVRDRVSWDDCGRQDDRCECLMIPPVVIQRAVQPGKPVSVMMCRIANDLTQNLGTAVNTA